MRSFTLSLVACFMLLSSASHSNAQQFILPDDSVWGFAWSPDSKQIAVGRYDGNVEILDASSKEIAFTLATQINSQIVAVAWSSDGKIISGSNETGKIFLWDVSNGTLLYQLSSLEDENFDYLAFSPDDTRIAGSTGYWLQIWDIYSGEMLIHDYIGTGLTWFGNTIASGTGQAIALKDASNSKYIKHIGWHETIQIINVDWNSDGTKIASGSIDGLVGLGSSDSEKATMILSCDTLPVTQVDWSPDATKVVASSLDGKICIWDSVTGEVLTTLQEAAPVLYVQWSPDGTQIAFSGDSEGLGGKIQIVETDKILPLAPTPSMSPA